MLWAQPVLGLEQHPVPRFGVGAGAIRPCWAVTYTNPDSGFSPVIPHLVFPRGMAACGDPAIKLA
jgi:hypothetical protein